MKTLLAHRVNQLEEFSADVLAYDDLIPSEFASLPKGGVISDFTEGSSSGTFASESFISPFATRISLNRFSHHDSRGFCASASPKSVSLLEDFL